MPNPFSAQKFGFPALVSPFPECSLTGETMVVMSPPPGAGPSPPPAAVVLGAVVRADMCPWAPIVWMPCGVCTMVCKHRVVVSKEKMC